jgi:hypothetical protein
MFGRFGSRRGVPSNLLGNTISQVFVGNQTLFPSFRKPLSPAKPEVVPFAFLGFVAAEPDL